MSLKIRQNILALVSTLLILPAIARGIEAPAGTMNRTNEVLPDGTVKAILKTNKYFNKRNQFYVIGFFLEKEKSVIYITNSFNITDFKSLEIFSNDGKQISRKIEKVPETVFYKVELSTPMKSKGLVPLCEATVDQITPLKTWTFRVQSLDRSYFNKGLIARNVISPKNGFNGKAPFDLPLEFSVHPLSGTPVIRVSDGKMVGTFASYSIKNRNDYFVLPAQAFCDHEFIEEK